VEGFPEVVKWLRGKESTKEIYLSGLRAFEEYTKLPRSSSTKLKRIGSLAGDAEERLKKLYNYVCNKAIRQGEPSNYCRLEEMQFPHP